MFVVPFCTSPSSFDELVLECDSVVDDGSNSAGNCPRAGHVGDETNEEKYIQI